MSKLLVIIGITGQQGGSVANTFIGNPSYRIRGITRHPDKPSNQHLRDRGVELVAADLDNVESLRKAFAGAQVIFAVTDFWQFMADPASSKAAAAQGTTINQVSFDREVAQGKNIIDAAASISSLERFVLSTLSHTRKWSRGNLVHNYHFDSKGVFTEYMQNAYAELTSRSHLLHVGMYMSNWAGFGILCPKKQSDGTYLLRYPISPTKPIPFVDPPSDTGVFVQALLAAAPGTNLLGVSQERSMAEFVAAWGAAAGKNARYQHVPFEEWRLSLPTVLADELTDMMIAVDELGWCGGESVVMPRDIGIPDEDLTSLEMYFSRVDWSAEDAQLLLG